MSTYEIYVSELGTHRIDGHGYDQHGQKIGKTAEERARRVADLVRYAAAQRQTAEQIANATVRLTRLQSAVATGRLPTLDELAEGL